MNKKEREGRGVVIGKEHKRTLRMAVEILIDESSQLLLCRMWTQCGYSFKKNQKFGCFYKISRYVDL